MNKEIIYIGSTISKENNEEEEEEEYDDGIYECGEFGDKLNKELDEYADKAESAYEYLLTSLKMYAKEKPNKEDIEHGLKIIKEYKNEMEKIFNALKKKSEETNKEYSDMLENKFKEIRLFDISYKRTYTRIIERIERLIKFVDRHSMKLFGCSPKGEQEVTIDTHKPLNGAINKMQYSVRKKYTDERERGIIKTHV